MENAYARSDVIAELVLALQRCPELRVGQLIVNAAGGDAAPFYITDADLAVALKAYPPLTSR